MLNCDAQSFLDYCKDVSKYSRVLSDGEVIELARNIRERNCRKSREKLINHNLRLVIKEAKKYANKGLPLADLIQEGNIGLMEAVELFDPKKGFKFSTFAVWRIKHSITRAIHDKGCYIRIPVWFHTYLNKYGKVMAEFKKANKTEPTIQELAEATGYTEQRITEIRRVKRLIKHVRFEDKVDDTCDIFISDAMTSPDDVEEEFEDRQNEEDMKRDVNLLLSRLSFKNKDILEKKYGLKGKMKPLYQIAKEQKTTVQQIEKTERRILKRLRSNKNLTQLKEYLN